MAQNGAITTSELIDRNLTFLPVRWQMLNLTLLQPFRAAFFGTTCLVCIYFLLDHMTWNESPSKIFKIKWQYR